MSAAKLAIVKELHKPARRNYLRRRVEVRGLDETWQADLVDMMKYAKWNNKYNYILTVIDIFSKYAWAVPVKSKDQNDVTAAMESIFVEGRIPKNLHVDRGGEFYNKKFESLITRHNINMYSTFSNLKASICERFNRTLKEKMWMQFSLQGNYKWINILPNLIAQYNNIKHHTIKMKPSDVNARNEKSLLQRVYTNFKIKTHSKKFNVGDKVRVSKFKHVFEKGYTPNWTTEVFTIRRIRNSLPVTTYELVDYQNQPIAGTFYEQELQKTANPDIYLVEKIVRKQGDKLFVKWLGFDNSHNSWINKTDL